MSQMEINDIKRLSDIPLPAGVTLVDLAHGRDEPVASIHHPRAEEVEARAGRGCGRSCRRDACCRCCCSGCCGCACCRWRRQEGRGQACRCRRRCCESSGCAEEGRRQEVTHAGKSARRCGMIPHLEGFGIRPFTENEDCCPVVPGPFGDSGRLVLLWPALLSRSSSVSAIRDPSICSRVTTRASGSWTRLRRRSARAFAVTRDSRARSVARSCRAAK